MGWVISFEERPVKARGLNKLAKPSQEKVKEYFFPDDYQNLLLLLELPKIECPENPILFYPGCGADILFPLKYIEYLFPHLHKVTFLFNDLDNNFGIIKTILDGVGISFAEKNKLLQFYWDGILVDLNFIQGNVFELLPRLPAFDIYFERAFRIMKDYHEGYEEQAYHKLKPGGIIISDSGFQHLPLQKLPVPQELSSYREMIIGVKE